MNTLFIFGLGYSASHFAKQARAKGWHVMGTSREAKPLDGIEVIPFDGQSPLAGFEERLKDVTHILHSIPPDKDKGDCVFNLHGQDLEKLKALKWMGYLSTTGVYGNADGAMVNEDSPRHPGSARSRARKKAEDDWLSLNLPIHIFRLAGIYGPGRNLFHQINKGTARAIDKPGHVFSRIHQEDIAGVLWASIARPQPHTAYNVCDDEACEPVLALNEACRIMGVEPPHAKPFDEIAKTMSAMALTFWQDNKRVDNSRIKDNLDYHFKYPTYREGLRAIWEQEFS
ncbi:MAG: SDR family oxidoreductase [Methylocystaceae bacterium]|nr:SDR family oxidoreductase [Methylocystaceae bacterium]